MIAAAFLVPNPFNAINCSGVPSLMIVIKANSPGGVPWTFAMGLGEGDAARDFRLSVVDERVGCVNSSVSNEAFVEFSFNGIGFVSACDSNCSTSLGMVACCVLISTGGADGDATRDFLWSESDGGIG